MKITNDYLNILDNTSNTLSYFLQLPTHSNDQLKEITKHSNDAEITSWIDQIFITSHSSCGKVCFRSNGFFSFEEKELTPTDFAFLDQSTKFWAYITKQHVILDSYDKIRKIASTQKNLSRYSFAKLLQPYDTTKSYTEDEIDMILAEPPKEDSAAPKGKKSKNGLNNDSTSNKYGLYYLIKNGFNSNNASITSLNKKEIKYVRKKGGTFNPYNSSRHTSMRGNLNTRVKNLYEDLSASCNITCLKEVTNSVFYNKHEQAKIENAHKSGDTVLKSELEEKYFKNNQPNILTQLNSYELTQLTIGQRENNSNSKINGILAAHSHTKPFTPSVYTKLIDDYKVLLSHLGNKDLLSEKQTLDPAFNFELADKVYARYILERVFCMSSIDYMYHSTSSNENSDFWKDNMNTLARISMLPNPFGRDLILQMSLDAYNHNFDKRGRRVTVNKKYGLTKLEPLSRTRNAYNKDNLWTARFEEMTNALHKFIFPIYESHFFSLLWNTARTYCNTDDECIDLLFIVLSKYLNQPANIKKLLSSDDFISSLGGTPPDYSLEESLNFTKSIDFSFYKECISCYDKGSAASSDTPLFLDMEYLLKLMPGLSTKIQNQLYNAAIQY